MDLQKTGTVQRKRGVRSASCLLKMLFLYACPSISFRVLAAAYALGISDISGTSLRKHFSKYSRARYAWFWKDKHKNQENVKKDRFKEI